MCELLINILGTIIGGLILTFSLFLINEFIFPKKNLTGEWQTITQTKKTTYNPYIDLKIEYQIHLIQKGYELSGSGEKVKDIMPNGEETVFKREKRVNIDIDGYFERRYFRKSKVYLNITEEGRIRESRSTYVLTLKTKNTLLGNFISTAADSSGIVNMTRCDPNR